MEKKIEEKSLKERIRSSLIENLGLSDRQASMAVYDFFHELEEAINKEKVLNNNDTKSDLFEQAKIERSNLISDINRIMEEYNLNCFYKINANGEINFNPNGFYDNKECFDRYAKSLDSMFFDVYCGGSEAFYEPCYELTDEEYEYIKSKNYDKEVYYNLMKKKYIDKINEFEENKITDIDLNDSIPPKYIIDYHFNESGFNNTEGFNVTEDVISWIKKDITLSISKLREQYGYINYISQVIDYIEKSVDKIKCPEISREKMMELATIYAKENGEKIEDYYKDNILKIEDENRRIVFDKYYEKRKLKESKKELEEQKGIFNSSTDSNGPKM